jgi:hypothetical protein
MIAALLLAVYLSAGSLIASAGAEPAAPGGRAASVSVEAPSSPIALILAEKDALALTPEQLRLFADIDLDLRAATVRLLSERELLRIAAQRDHQAGKAPFGMTAEQVRAIEGKTLELKLAWLAAADRARDVLSPEQQVKVPWRFADAPSFTATAGAPGPEDLDSRIAGEIGIRLKEGRPVAVRDLVGAAQCQTDGHPVAPVCEGCRQKRCGVDWC